MPFSPERHTATEVALTRTLSAAEWLSRARVAMVEPNGDGAAAAFLQHARTRLLEAAALCDPRPRSLMAALPAPAKESRP